MTQASEKLTRRDLLRIFEWVAWGIRVGAPIFTRTKGIQVMRSAPPGRPALILVVVADGGSQQIQSVVVALDFVQYVLAFDFLSAAAEED
jgi:hypothetical protein